MNFPQKYQLTWQTLTPRAGIKLIFPEISTVKLTLELSTWNLSAPLKPQET